MKKPGNRDIIHFYEECFAALINYFKRNLLPHWKIGFIIRSSDETNKPLHHHFRLVQELDVEVLWALIYRVAQSNADFLLKGSLMATVHVIEIPRGGHRRSRVFASTSDFIKQSRGVIQIFNNGNRCLAHAIIVGLAVLNGTSKAAQVQEDEASIDAKSDELLELSGIDLRHGGSLEELNILQSVLPPDVQIVVFSSHSTKEIMFKGRVKDATRHIYLYFNNDHFDVISNVCQFCLSSYFCTACFKPHDDNVRHRCPFKCKGCRKIPICPKDGNCIECDGCKRTFLSNMCFQNHFLNNIRGKSVCDVYKFCELCCRSYTLFKNRKPHICQEIFCNNCRSHVPKGHKCYIRKIKNSLPSTDDKLLVYFDIESTINTRISNNNSDGTLHICNLIIAHSHCGKCIKDECIDDFCWNCGIRKHVFQDNPVKEFMEFLCLPRKYITQVYIYSHNFRGYDHVPIIRYMVEEMKASPKLIMRGTQVISADYKRLHFRDMLNFIPLPLRSLPACLGIENSTLEKGTYPYLFNTVENIDYIGPIPEKHFYDPEAMSVEQRAKFNIWHDKLVAENYVFNNRIELIRYCNTDVEILRRCGNKFRSILLSIANVDPLFECLTLANCAFMVFRRHFLKENTIGIIPNKGYRLVDTQSKCAIKWLVHMERVYDRRIQHSGNGREYKLSNGMIVDGYLEYNNEKIIFEFFGCIYHFCKKCYPSSDKNFLNEKGVNLALARESTDRKIKKLRDLGYIVITKWECEFRKELAENEELRTFVENHPLIKNEPLNPREALYGGRVEAIKLYAESDDTHDITFSDFRSLYPYSMKYFMVPIKHPILHLQEPFPNI